MESDTGVESATEVAKTKPKDGDVAAEKDKELTMIEATETDPRMKEVMSLLILKFRVEITIDSRLDMEIPSHIENKFMAALREANAPVEQGKTLTPKTKSCFDRNGQIVDRSTFLEQEPPELLLDGVGADLQAESPFPLTIKATFEFVAPDLSALLPLADDIIQPLPKPREAAVPRLRELSLEDTLLGQGSFAQVVLARAGADGGAWATKMIKKHEMIKLKKYSHACRMIDLGMRWDHPHALQVDGYSHDQSWIYVFCPAYPTCLFNVLRKVGNFDNEVSKQCASHIAAGLLYMHSYGVVHRNLKPEGILVGGDGLLKVGSMMTAKFVGESHTFTMCGTPEYIAPEVLLNSGHGRAADIWSFGVLVYELLVGKPPFCADDPMAIYQLILQGRFCCPTSEVSVPAERLVRACLRMTPQQRPCFAALAAGPTGFWLPPSGKNLPVEFPPNAADPIPISERQLRNKDAPEVSSQHDPFTCTLKKKRSGLTDDADN